MAGQGKHRTLFRAHEKSASWLHSRDNYDYAMSALCLARPLCASFSDGEREILQVSSIGMLCLGSPIRDNQIRRIAKKKTNQEPPHHDFGGLEPLGDAKKFGDNVHNRACGKRQKQEKDLR